MTFVVLLYGISVCVVMIEFQLHRHADTASTMEWLEGENAPDFDLNVPPVTARDANSEIGDSETEDSAPDSVSIGPGSKVSITPGTP